MSDAKRPDAKRRVPRTRPARGGDAARERPRSTAGSRDDTADARPANEPAAESITASIAAAAARQSEQRLGFTARRAAILAMVVCVLTLTIAGPVRTYFAQRTEMQQEAALEAVTRAQIADLEQQKAKLDDPAYIKSEARSRLGYVMPGEIPYQMQAPPGAVELSEQPGESAANESSGDPWYTTLWHTIADTPHNIPAPAGPAPAPPPGAAPPGG